MKNVSLLIVAAMAFTACEFEKADYYDRYGNIDFGEDTGNSTASSFDYSGSSYDGISTRNNYYRGEEDETASKKSTKKNYGRHYMGGQ